MIDWSKNYTASWRLMKVNDKTWLDSEEIPGVVSVSITKDGTDDYPLLETGSITIDSSVDYEFEDGYYRVEMLVRQYPEAERYDIATLLLESTDGTVNRGKQELVLDGRSVLQAASDQYVLAGEYIPKGSNGPEWVADRLRRCLQAPVTIIGDGFTVDDDIGFDGGTSELQVSWTVLDSGNWIISILGDGTVQLMEKPKVDDPILVLDRANAGMLQPDFSFADSRVGIPNRYIVVDGKESYTAVNEDYPGSRTSVAYRGRYVDYYDSSPTRINGETLDQYARRRLEEESTRSKIYTYKREYWPDANPFMVVQASLASNGLEGNLRILSQSLMCSHGISVQEKAGYEIKEYMANGG